MTETYRAGADGQQKTTALLRLSRFSQRTCCSSTPAPPSSSATPTSAPNSTPRSALRFEWIESASRGLDQVQTGIRRNLSGRSPSTPSPPNSPPIISNERPDGSPLARATLSPTPPKTSRSSKNPPRRRHRSLPHRNLYGLGASALDATAVSTIFTAEERPSSDPVIVHVSDRAMLDRLHRLPTGRTPHRLLAWPAHPPPARTEAIADGVTAGRLLVGVRMPAHPSRSPSSRAAGVPSPPPAPTGSAGPPHPAAHVLDGLDHRIDAILDAGPTAVGVGSTVLDPNRSRSSSAGPAPSPPPCSNPSSALHPLPTRARPAEPHSLPLPRSQASDATPPMPPSLWSTPNASPTIASDDSSQIKKKLASCSHQDWTIIAVTSRLSLEPFDDDEALPKPVQPAFTSSTAAALLSSSCPLPTTTGLASRSRPPPKTAESD